MAKGRPKGYVQGTLEIVKDNIKSLPDKDLEIVINYAKATILERRKDSLQRLYEKAWKAWMATPSEHNSWLMALIEAKLHTEFGIQPLRGSNQLAYDLAKLYETKNETWSVPKSCQDKIGVYGLNDGVIEYIYKHTHYDEYNGKFMRRS